MFARFFRGLSNNKSIQKAAVGAWAVGVTSLMLSEKKVPNPPLKDEYRATMEMEKDLGSVGISILRRK